MVLQTNVGARKKYFAIQAGYSLIPKEMESVYADVNFIKFHVVEVLIIFMLLVMILIRIRLNFF
ncbi:MAG: hypothetical protein ACMXYK_04545 [Candidatus Woesearchaeota archaeon]